MAYLLFTEFCAGIVGPVVTVSLASLAESSRQSAKLACGWFSQRPADVICCDRGSLLYCSRPGSLFSPSCFLSSDGCIAG